MSLRLQLLLLQALIVSATVIVAGVVAGSLQERQLRDAYLDRMLGVAQSVAGIPAIREAFQTDDPAAIIQPIAEVIRKASDVTYVVVTNVDGVRYSHPDPSRIGEVVSTDPAIPLSGETYVGTQTGTLGESWRAKVPLYSDGGDIIGTASVGILESALQDEFVGELGWLVLAVTGSAVLGVFGSAWVTAVIRKRIFRLEPPEIASLVGSRETMLHGMSEGVVSVDENGRVTLVNDAALDLLGLARHDVAGRPAEEILDPSLLAVLESGEPDGRLVLSGERILVARSTGTMFDGRTVGAALLVRDHTDLHRLLREMDGAQSLTDGLRAQAHEFANKMHVVSGLLEMDCITEARAFIASTRGGRALGLADDEAVLDNPELTALLIVKASQARELGISLEIVRSQPLPALLSTEAAARLRGDLVTVVGNLVDNAIEACSAGNRIHLRFVTETVNPLDTRSGDVAAAAADLVVTVGDDGAGIPPEQYERVFVAGVSSKAPAGSDQDDPRMHRRGIGLALVRRVVVRNGGTVQIGRSDLGGALFTLRVPLTPYLDRGLTGVHR